MTLTTCNRHCPHLNYGTCELGELLEQGQPVLCPYYRQRQTAILNGSINPQPGGLPGNFATRPHYRYDVDTHAQHSTLS